MHDGMPYDPTKGQGQGHDCLKAIQEDLTISPARAYFYFLQTVFFYYALFDSMLCYIGYHELNGR